MFGFHGVEDYTQSPMNSKPLGRKGSPSSNPSKVVSAPAKVAAKATKSGGVAQREPSAKVVAKPVNKVVAKAVNKAVDKAVNKVVTKAPAIAPAKTPTKSQPIAVETPAGRPAKIDINGYQAALKWLSERPDIERMRVVKYDDGTFRLDRMRALLAAMGNPHEQIKAVHVAGTVGKVRLAQ